MDYIKPKVKAWQETVIIPTYEIGKADKNPMFLEKRVYQGSSGKVYPLPVIDKIYDEKIDKEYTAVYLENDYLKIMILPELGGRIQRAYDKTNDYDFVYYNEVIKPALVGLTGPWISGGIEFNWPQHHRPTTYSPVDYLISENDDGSQTVRISETDQMYGTKGMASFTLYPDKAYIEIKGQLYNPTNMPQTFLWWANPAVAVNDNTQSVFPPDVNAVMDHGKRAVSKFPIATGEYYKHDYGEGVDISRYKNIPVPTSYMAYHSDFNFVGGYDYGVEAGILHIADHHVSPGKKQWTWGCGDFGKAWDRNLTDENGPYIELMTGMFTDNQPDFTWLKPFEEKTFTQYFMPYKKAGYVKNASTDVVLNLEKVDENAIICVYATSIFKDATIELKANNRTLFKIKRKLSPTDIFENVFSVGDIREEDLTLTVYDCNGNLLLSYQPAPKKLEKIPEPAQPVKSPEDIKTNEELLFAAMHIEQYRHATYDPDPYYLEGLKHDPNDSRINVSYGVLLLRRGLFSESEKHFRKAIERVTLRNPNPFNSEPYYYLGVSLLYQNKLDKAFDAFYKATWTSAEQEMSFYYLASIAAKQGRYQEAKDFVTRSLVKNNHNVKARGLLAYILRKLGQSENAIKQCNDNIALDPFDYLSMLEHCLLTDKPADEIVVLMRGEAKTLLALAREYILYGAVQEAIDILKLCPQESPMIAYYTAYCYYLNGNTNKCNNYIDKAELCCSDYCFPNKLEDINVLEFVISINEKASKALYYLGNLYYDKKQYIKAKQLWEKSSEICADFPTVWRNLSLAYFNKENNSALARKALEKAFALDKTDARVFLELDQLYKKLGMSPKERLQNFNSNRETFEKRDDLWVEYITLQNLLGNYEIAYSLIMSHKFHPWEGGEGKITTQYTLSLIELAKIAISQNHLQKARKLLLNALVFPENLGEGKLEGAKDNNVYYYLGCVCDALGETEEAKLYWEKACLGNDVPAGMMYYNDQPADLILYQGLAAIKLGNLSEAKGKFNKLIDYGEAHIFDEVKIEYFAVSLPDLQLFDEDLTLKNKAHCHYLIGLGKYGMGDVKTAIEECTKTLEIEHSHIGATLHKKMFIANK